MEGNLHLAYDISPSTSDSAGASTAERAPQACISCRKQKRGCNKALPACRLCNRMGRMCDYSDTPAVTTSAEVVELTQKIKELENRLAEQTATSFPMESAFTSPCGGTISGKTNFTSQCGGTKRTQHLHLASQPAAMADPYLRAPWTVGFLDPRLFRTLTSQFSPISEAPLDLMSHIGGGIEIGRIAAAYCTQIQTWLPMLSKGRLSSFLHTTPCNRDVLVLVLAMKLILSRIDEGSSAADHHLYILCKQHISALRSVSPLSLSTLQAMILVTLFEHGHAIHPAAWDTIVQCVQYVNMLDLTMSKEEFKSAIQPLDPVQAEERHRTCWAVYVLERVIGISSQRCLFMEEPLPTDVLPIDEAAWEQSTQHGSVIRNVSAPYSDPQCAFARLCQAANIAGKVIRHTEQAARQKARGQRFDCMGLVRLTATAQSLCASLFADFTAAPKSYWVLICSRSLAFSSVMTLLRACSLVGTIPAVADMLDPALTDEELSLQVNSADGLRATAAHIAEYTNNLLTLIARDHGLDKVSPFVLDSIYQSASALSWLKPSSDLGALGLETNAQTLLEIGRRWGLGIEYLKCLEMQRPGITALAYTLSGRIDMVGGGNVDISSLGFE